VAGSAAGVSAKLFNHDQFDDFCGRNATPEFSKLNERVMPAVEDFFHLDGLFLPEEAARRLVGLGPGVTFDLDWDELHLRVFNRIEHKEFLMFTA
jgi:hypothetical protein